MKKRLFTFLLVTMLIITMLTPSVSADKKDLYSSEELVKFVLDNKDKMTADNIIAELEKMQLNLDNQDIINLSAEGSTVIEELQVNENVTISICKDGTFVVTELKVNNIDSSTQGIAIGPLSIPYEEVSSSVTSNKHSSGKIIASVTLYSTFKYNATNALYVSKSNTSSYDSNYISSSYVASDIYGNKSDGTSYTQATYFFYDKSGGGFGLTCILMCDKYGAIVKSAF